MSSSLYCYTDKSVRNAGIAAIVYGVVALASALLEWLQFFLYHRPSGSDLLDHNWLSQQWLEHTPARTAVAFVIGVLIAAISGILAFGIFRRRKIAIVLMLLLVIGQQLYIWFIVHSISGSLVSIVVAAFLARGAARIFERSDEAHVSQK
jgi:ABC-type branched-subunit amino acid transport system permease subunit